MVAQRCKENFLDFMTPQSTLHRGRAEKIRPKRLKEPIRLLYDRTRDVMWRVGYGFMLPFFVNLALWPFHSQTLLNFSWKHPNSFQSLLFSSSPTSNQSHLLRSADSYSSPLRHPTILVSHPPHCTLRTVPFITFSPATVPQFTFLTFVISLSHCKYPTSFGTSTCLRPNRSSTSTCSTVV